jgi:hypothetical protein
MEEITEARQTLAYVMEHSEDGPEQDANRVRFLFLSSFQNNVAKTIKNEVFESTIEKDLPEMEVFF